MRSDVKRILVVGLLGLAGIGPATADFIVAPPNRIVSNAIFYDRALHGYAAVFDQVRQVYAARAGLSGELAKARGDFWGGLSKTDGYEERYANYLKLLLAKDYVYMTSMLSYGPGRDESFVLSQFGGAVDGGIPTAAASPFEAWVSAIRLHHGVKQGEFLWVLSTDQFLDGLNSPGAIAAYNKYRRYRDRVEFVSAGHGAYFDKMILDADKEGSASKEVAFTVSDPRKSGDSFVKQRKRLSYRYQSVPEDFSPSFDATEIGTEVAHVSHDMAIKETPNALKTAELLAGVSARWFASDYRTDKELAGRVYTDTNSFIEFESFLDRAMGLTGNRNYGEYPLVLKCTYGFAYNWQVVVGWYRSKPRLPSSGPFPEALQLLASADVMENCPAFTELK